MEVERVNGMTEWYEEPSQEECEYAHRDEVNRLVRFYCFLAGNKNGGVVVVNDQVLRLALSRALLDGMRAHNFAVKSPVAEARNV